MDFETLKPIHPHFFFLPEVECFFLEDQEMKSKNRLPLFQEFRNGEKPFTQVFMAWTDRALLFEFQVGVPFQQTDFPNFERHDVIELFVQTRIHDQMRYLNRFSHHFLFFPVQLNGVMALEVTRFRTEDRHELAIPEAFYVDSKIGQTSYQMRIELSQDVLFGFDPDEIKELRVDYRVHRYQANPQFFFHPSEGLTEHSLDLWPKIILKK